MKQINLLPDSYKNNLIIERLLKGVIVAQAVALFLSILFAVVFNVLSDKLYEKNVEYSEYIQSSKYLESEEIIKDVDILVNRIESLERLRDSIEKPDSVTDKDIKYIFSFLPKGVFADTVSFDTGSNKVIFAGLSEESSSIAMFVDALAMSGDFAEIVIKNMTLKENDKMVSFTLDIYFVEGDI